MEELEDPVPKDDQVRVRVHASTVTAVDATFRRGDDFFARLFTGLLRPKHRIPGGDLAGEIETVGKDVTRFQVGDRVFGTVGEGFGAHAELVCVSEREALSTMPPALGYDQAAALPYGFLTALPFLRDEAKLARGQRLLVNGASGPVGAAAVELGKHFGAEVTGVCSASGLDLVRSLGADQVIDYGASDFTQNGERYDVIFDAAGKTSFSRCRRSLTEHGVFLTPVLSLGILVQKARTRKTTGRRATIAFTGLRPAPDKTRDLEFLKELVAAGKLQPIIDSRYPLERITEAHARADGHKQGSVVVSIRADDGA